MSDISKEVIKGWEDCFNNMEHVWGIPAEGIDCNLFTLNDFDITYYKNIGKYIMEIETIYDFDSPDAERRYLVNICNKFTDWMDENGYNTYKKLLFSDLFNKNLSIKSEFDTIEDLYAVFAMLVRTYVGE